RWPRLWHRLQAWSFRLTYGMGKPPSPERIPALNALVTAERANASVQSTESPQPQPSSVK
ncbi:MAG: hypothetical protein AAGB13_17615, partial [Cyanobacteria bacterium P01_F01_bin.33]